MKQNFIFYLLALIIVFSLKLHYSRADSEELDWILRPTAGMVEAISSVHFVREKGVGYINQEHYLIIAPSCAGVNFLIAAFCVAIYSFTHRLHLLGKKIGWFFGNMVAIYLLTIFVNTIRILLAIALVEFEAKFIWFTPQQIHRLEGIMVYFGFLCVYYIALNALVAHFSFPKPHVFGVLCMPFIWYLALTLFVPLLNPVSHTISRGFFEHGMFVLVGSGILVFLISTIRTGINRIFVYKAQKHSSSASCKS